MICVAIWSGVIILPTHCLTVFRNHILSWCRFNKTIYWVSSAIIYDHVVPVLRMRYTRVWISCWKFRHFAAESYYYLFIICTLLSEEETPIHNQCVKLLKLFDSVSLAVSESYLLSHQADQPQDLQQECDLPGLLRGCYRFQQTCHQTVQGRGRLRKHHGCAAGYWTCCTSEMFGGPPGEGQGKEDDNPCIIMHSFWLGKNHEYAFFWRNYGLLHTNGRRRISSLWI